MKKEQSKQSEPGIEGLAGEKPGSRTKKKSSRDLLRAETLRPREVYELYGMPETTVSDLCSHPDPEMRIASYKIPGRQGRKGSRYIDHAAFKQWFKKWRCMGSAA